MLHWYNWFLFELEQFQEYYVRIYGNSEHISPVKKGQRSGIKVTRLLRELSEDEMTVDDDDLDDEDDQLPAAIATPVDPRKPWLKDFNYYINMPDQLAEDQTIVQWWGVSHSCYYDW